MTITNADIAASIAAKHAADGTSIPTPALADLQLARYVIVQHHAPSSSDKAVFGEVKSLFGETAAAPDDPAGRGRIPRGASGAAESLVRAPATKARRSTRRA